MDDIENAIAIAEATLATADELIDTINKTRQSLEETRAQLQQLITKAKQKMANNLATDRQEADDDLDKKFDHSGPKNDDDDEDTKS